MLLRMLLLGNLVYFMSFGFSYAGEKWCIEDQSQPPCGGAAGRCTTNMDGSLGGFVAYSARVWAILTPEGMRNVPYIGRYAQVCDSALIMLDAQILDRARVTGSAHVSGHAEVSGNAHISGRAFVTAGVRVTGDAKVLGNAQISGSAQIFGQALIDLQAFVTGNAVVSGRARVAGEARVDGNAQVSGNACVFENARVLGSAAISGNARISGHAEVSGNALIGGDAWVYGNALLVSGVRDGGVIGSLREGGTAEPPVILPPGPGAALVLPDERPQPAFEQAYSGSEAETYRTYLDQRHSCQASFHGRVDVLGEEVDANSYDMDGIDAFETGYEIKNVRLARVLSRLLKKQIQQGDVLHEREVLENEAVGIAIQSSAADEYDRNPYAFPAAASESHPLEDEAGRYLEFVRRTIFTKLEELNRLTCNQVYELFYQDSQRRRDAGVPDTYPLCYFQNPHYPSEGGIYIHDSLHPVYKFTGAVFFKIMDAIKENDERNFLVHMINLATAFHPSRIEARNGLIEAYTYLYVAKRFPNRLVRQRYFHFTLNCGGIY